MANFIVNPGGAVHSVEEGEFTRLTLSPGYRAATADEIAGWYERQGLSVPPEFISKPSTSSSPSTDANSNRISDNNSAPNKSDVQ